MLLGPVTKWALMAAAVIILAPLAMLLILSVTSRRPATLGPVMGKLRPCPDSPNCVCSCDDRGGHAIAPLIWKGEASAGIQKLLRIIGTFPNTHCEPVSGDGYLHAEFTSTWFRFVDDVEFLVDAPAGVIHVRSASRAGKSDLGVNRLRVERIRDLFQAAE